MSHPAPATPATIALVRAPVAPLHGEARVSAPQVSQALFGHGLLVLGAEGEWQRVRALLDGYEGWVHAGYLHLVELPDLPDDAQTFGPWDARRWAVRPDAPADPGDAAALRSVFAAMEGESALSLGCTVSAGARTLRLPLGALVHAAQTVVDGLVVPLPEQPARFPRDGAALAATAQAFFEGTSYQWGGTTPWGADCSGFVQAACALHGVDLPRDAWQQATVGDDLGADLDAALPALAPGDLLFFSDRPDRRVTHVGLAVGEGRMAHLALGRGGWSVDDLAAVDDPYVARLRAGFTGARRVV